MNEKYEGEVSVLFQEKLAKDICSLWLLSKNIAQSALAGQFLLLYPKDRSKLLGRPMSFCEIDRAAGALRIVYRVTGPNTGTQEFSRLKAGDTLRVLGPMGNGFPLSKTEGKKSLVIGGGTGVFPLLGLSKELKGEKTLVMGFKSAPLLSEEFKAEGAYFLATEDGSAGIKGNVLDAVRQEGLCGDVVFACGPSSMLRAVKKFAQEKNIDCYVSLEERMACGLGACLGCVCRSKEVDARSMVRYKRVCRDGPVFLASEVEF